MTVSATTSTASRRRSAMRSRCCTSTRRGTPTRTSTSSTTAIHGDLLGASCALAARDHLRHPLDAQAARGALAGVDDPRPERRRRSELDFTRFNDAFMMHTVDLAALRHHRFLRRRRRDDGAAGRARARAGDDRRGAELPPRHGEHGAAARTAAGGSRSGSPPLAERAPTRRPVATGSCAGRGLARLRGTGRRTM